MHSESTTNYHLPIWQMSDHPDFLTDLNQAMQTIDSNLHTASENASSASESVQTIADTVQKNVEDIAALKVTVQQHGESITNLQTTVDNLQKSSNAHESDITMLKTTVGKYTDDAGIASVWGALDYSLSTLNGYDPPSKVKDDIRTLDVSLQAVENQLSANARKVYQYNVTPTKSVNITITHSDASYINAVVKNQVLWVGLHTDGIVSFINDNKDGGTANVSDKITFSIPTSSPIYTELGNPNTSQVDVYGVCTYPKLDGSFISINYRVYFANTINIELYPVPLVTYELQNVNIWFNPIEIATKAFSTVERNISYPD